MKPTKLFFFSALFLLVASASIVAQPIEQSLARLFSYDPHPATAKFADPAPYNGELVDVEIKFSETWTEKKNSANISRIFFTVSAKKSGKVVATIDTSKFNINTSAAKGTTIGEATLGNLKFKAVLDSLVKGSGGVTDLTVVFSLAYQMDELNVAKSVEANKSTSSSMFLCEGFVKKADAMPAKNVKSKIGLYKKALMVAPAAISSPAAAAFRQMVEKKIAALGGSVVPTPPMPKVAPPIEKMPVIQSLPTKATPTVTATPSPIKQSLAKPEAIALYQQAKTFFATDRGPDGREALRKALEISPDYYDALVLLGENAFNNRKFTRAKEAFTKALDLNDKNPDTMLKFFKACYYKGEGSEAIEKLLEIKNRYPKSHGIKLTLSEAYFQLGDLPSARSLCEEVLASDPSNYQGKDLLKRIDRLMK